MNLFKFLLFIFYISIVSAHTSPDASLLTGRPLMILETRVEEDQVDEIQMYCRSWRFAVESNNMQSWKTIPEECAYYVYEYMMNKPYRYDLKIVSKEAGIYAKSIELAGDGKDIWIFDIDETLLSNLPYYADHGFGLEVFDGKKFDEWVYLARAPAIESSLKLYQEVLALGFKVFLLTGRSEEQRDATVRNLKDAGFENWDRLILRNLSDQGKPAIIYKSEKRMEMMKEGYRILGNSGDQWSDLLGSSLGNRSFKLPNPMYYIP